MKTKGKVYPKDLYLVSDANHEYHFYLSDPMKTRDRAGAEVNIGELISDFIGGDGTVANPIVVALNCAAIQRCEPFAISQPGAIRTGQLKKHFEDMEGRIVDILETKNSDPDFPFNGVLLSRNGAMLGVATYSVLGECKDGIEDHALVCMDGLIPSPEAKK